MEPRVRPCHVGMVIRQIVCTVRFARNDFFFLDHFGNEQGRRWFVFVGDCGGSIGGSASVVGHDFCRFRRRRFTGCAPHSGAVAVAGVLLVVLFQVVRDVR